MRWFITAIIVIVLFITTSVAAVIIYNKNQEVEVPLTATHSEDDIKSWFTEEEGEGPEKYVDYTPNPDAIYSPDSAEGVVVSFFEDVNLGHYDLASGFIEPNYLTEQINDFTDVKPQLRIGAYIQSVIPSPIQSLVIKKVEIDVMRAQVLVEVNDKQEITFYLAKYEDNEHDHHYYWYIVEIK